MEVREIVPRLRGNHGWQVASYQMGACSRPGVTRLVWDVEPLVRLRRSARRASITIFRGGIMSRSVRGEAFGAAGERCWRATAGLIRVLLISALCQGGSIEGADAQPPTARAPSAAWDAPTAPFDIVITNGRIIDGTGSPWYSGQIGIRAGH